MPILALLFTVLTGALASAVTALARRISPKGSPVGQAPATAYAYRDGIGYTVCAPASAPMGGWDFSPGREPQWVAVGQAR